MFCVDFSIIDKLLYIVFDMLLSRHLFRKFFEHHWNTRRFRVYVCVYACIDIFRCDNCHRYISNTHFVCELLFHFCRVLCELTLYSINWISDSINTITSSWKAKNDASEHTFLLTKFVISFMTIKTHRRAHARTPQHISGGKPEQVKCFIRLWCGATESRHTIMQIHQQLCNETNKIYQAAKRMPTHTHPNQIPISIILMHTWRFRRQQHYE